MQLPTWLNCELALFPMKATAAMMTTAMSATMSAYSTAVAPPSSWARVLSPSHHVVRPVCSRRNMSPPFRPGVHSGSRPGGCHSAMGYGRGTFVTWEFRVSLRMSTYLYVRRGPDKAHPWNDDP